MASGASRQTHGTTMMTRRRNKRTQLSTNSVDLRDPLSLLDLAVRFDESRGNESLLTVPLENGPIYNQKSFNKALQFLQKSTSVPRLSTDSIPLLCVPRRKVTTPSKRDQQHQTSSKITGERDNDGPASSSLRVSAIAPIILSGLLSALQEVDDDDENKQLPSSSELVGHCQTLRQAALHRVKRRNQRNKIQQTITPILLIVSVSVLFWWNLSNLKQSLEQLGYAGSCSQAGLYLDACRFIEAELWENLHQISQYRHIQTSSCTLEECPALAWSDERPVYTSHTQLYSFQILLEDLGSGKHRPLHSTRCRHPRGLSAGAPLRWLGETIVNGIVRQELEKFYSTSTATEDPWHLLDVGCGLGGTLYSILPSYQPAAKLLVNYTGIVLSRAEAQQAERLAALHRVPVTHSVQFVPQSFDARLPFQEYTSIVAIDALSYSEDLNVTLKNLASALKRNGLLIIVDDVVNTPFQEPSPNLKELADLSHRKALHGHVTWLSYLQAHGFEVHQMRDLGLQYELPVEQVHSWTLLTGDWYRRITERILDKWEQWFTTSRVQTEESSVRIIQLLQDLAKIEKAKSLRYASYRNGDLSYHLYVCTKMK